MLLEVLFGLCSGLFEDFFGSDFFCIGDDVMLVVVDIDDVVDVLFGEFVVVGLGVLCCCGSGLVSCISE